MSACTSSGALWVEISRRKKRADGTGYDTVTSMERVVVSVNMQRIAKEYGNRAAHNKKGVAKYMKGAVQIAHIDPTEVLTK